MKINRVGNVTGTYPFNDTPPAIGHWLDWYFAAYYVHLRGLHQ